jgi:AbrB family looped-hinge helix DNA binding protein
MSYSRVTKKGQVTIPSGLRKKYHIEKGRSVRFEPIPEGIVIKPVRDIWDSAGELSKYAEPEDVLKDILESRRKREFR